jgi:hypothetical protein
MHTCKTLRATLSHEVPGSGGRDCNTYRADIRHASPGREPDDPFAQ